MSWEDAEKRAKEAGGIFVKLANDKDKVVGAILGEPHTRETWFNPATNKTEDFTEQHRAEGKQPTAKFKLNFFNRQSRRMQILEVNSATLQLIAACKHKYGLETYWFEIERKGAKGDTKTTYAVLPDAQLSPDDLKEIKAAKLHDLAAAKEDDAATDLSSHDKAKAGANGTATNGTASAATNGAPVPAPAAAAPAAEVIGADVAAAMVTRLKVQPREKLTEFLTKFGIKQVKALKASDRAAAEAMLDAFEGKTPAAPAAPAEEDPFA